MAATKEIGKLEHLAEMAGIKLDDIAKLLEPMIANSVAKTLNEMKLADVISSTIEAKVKERTDAISTEVKTALEQIPAAQQAGQGQPQGSSLQQTILASIAQKVIGGGDSGDSMDKFLDRMMKFQQMGAMMYQNPMAQAAQMIMNMMKVSLGMGLTTKQVVEGVGALVEPTKQPPPQP